VKNTFPDEPRRLMGRSKVSNRIQMKLSVFIIALPIYPSYAYLNENSPVVGRVLDYPGG
jgi:hypothetical protein